MHPRSLWLTVLVFFLALATVLAPRLAHAEPAKRIYAGVYLHDVTKFEQKDGVFDVDLELWAKWLGDFDPEKLSVANAAEVDRTLLGESSDGTWHSARWRIRGTLRGEFPLQRFPFDHQTIAVVLELPELDGELVPDLAGSGMRERFSITGWLYEPSFVPRLGKEVYRSDLGSIATEGQSTTVRRAAFEVTLRRPLVMAATKLFLPLLVILLVALVALFIHPKELEVRASVGVTALLACFAFHFAVADTMPNVAYITLAEVLFLVSYGITAVLLFVSVIAYWYDSNDRTRAWQRLDLGALMGFPIVLGVAIALALRTPPVAQAAPPAALGGVRPVSARTALRVGTNSLISPSFGLAGRGTNWGTVRTELDGSETAGLVEEVPSITNDSLRFLADGGLEVTWRLRSGLAWSDGKPLTSEDLLFALAVSPDARIVESRANGPRELIVRFNERVASALQNITPLPRHALEAEYKKGGYEAVRQFRRTNVMPATGPYRVSDFVADDHLNLEANPSFAGPPPSIKHIEIRKYPDDAALVKAFENGEVDMIAPNAISPESAQDLAKRRADAVKIKPSEVQMFLHPDPSHPLLSRLEVRRAILMAIDRDRIRNTVFGEAAAAAPVSHVPIPGALPEKTTMVAYDPKAARQALEAAGAVGARLPLFHSKTPVDRTIAAQIVKDLVAIGIVAEASEVPNVQDVYRKRRHGGLLLRSTTGERDAPPEKYWALPQVDGKFDRSFRSDAYDDTIAALVHREERALYPERREQIRDELFAAYSQRLPTIPLLFLADRIVADPSLHGWEEGSGSNFGTSMERWYFAPPNAPEPAAAKDTAPAKQTPP